MSNHHSPSPPSTSRVANHSSTYLVNEYRCVYFEVSFESPLCEADLPVSAPLSETGGILRASVEPDQLGTELLLPKVPPVKTSKSKPTSPVVASKRLVSKNAAKSVRLAQP